MTIKITFLIRSLFFYLFFPASRSKKLAISLHSFAPMVAWILKNELGGYAIFVHSTSIMTILFSLCVIIFASSVNFLHRPFLAMSLRHLYWYRFFTLHNHSCYFFSLELLPWCQRTLIVRHSDWSVIKIRS